VSAINHAPVVDAGPDQTISLPAQANLHGAVADDGLPAGSTLGVAWTKISGPGTVTFNNAGDAATTASFSEPGSYLLELSASDSQFTTTSDVLITVKPPNQPPTVSAGATQTITLPDGVSLSGMVSDDGQPAGGALTISWAKVSGPGEVTFGNSTAAVTTAAFDQPGTYVLRLTASDSLLASSADVTVVVNPAAPTNQPPTVNAGPDQTITLPAQASLSGTVSDDGLPANSTVSVVWSKVSGPGTVTFSNPALTATSAAFSTAGTYVLRLTATDSQLTAADDLVVTVQEVPPVNRPPAVNAGPAQTVTLPHTASLVGAVSDDGLPAGGSLTVQWTKVSGPGTVAFSAPDRVTTTAAFSDPGAYVLRLTASDSELTASSEVNIAVNGPNQPPTVNAGPDLTVIGAAPASLHGEASDDGLPTGVSLQVTWGEVGGPGSVTFSNPHQAVTSATFSTEGVYTLRLTASDSELTSSDEMTVTVEAAPPPPVASIDSPADGSRITTLTNFVGTVSGGLWRLEYSLNSADGAPEQVWTAFASGSGPVNNAVLGAFDPTLLLNGSYTVRLIATDAAGQTTVSSVAASVTESQKIGAFHISFPDLNVPVAGLPIEVLRTYDSRDKGVGDFGVGWTLSLKNVRLEKTGVLGRDWEQVSSGGFLSSYCVRPTRPHTVTITFPDNKVYEFQATVSPQCQSLIPIETAAVNFTPMRGTVGTLEVVGDKDVLVAGSVPGPAELLGFDSAATFNAKLFRLTTGAGMAYVIDQQGGVRSLTDPNGNTLTVTPAGITHSSGKSILFERDAQGRITRITDPAGNAVSYNYDAAGDLVSFTDRVNNTTSFTYNAAHELLTINDPRGVSPLRNEYDADGRMIRQTDAFGQAINFTHDLSASREVVADRLGNVTVSEYDAAGNLTRVVDRRGGVTTRTFDADQNILTVTDPAGGTTTYTYDADGNRLSATDPLGQTTRYTYNARHQVLTVTDPQGRVTANTYDANGNLIETRDPLGNIAAAGYDGRGLRTSLTDALGHTTSYEYDDSGNVTKETDPLGNSVTGGYDANGNRLWQTRTRVLPSGTAQALTTSYEYDREGRLVKVTNPDGSTAEAIFDGNGLLVANIDGLGRRTERAYDEMGRLVRTTLPDGAAQESAYDAEGRRTRRTDAAGRSTVYDYDPLGQLEKSTFSDGSSTSIAYDAAGRAASVTDARGNTSRFQYDAAGRRTKVTDPLGRVTTYTYDASGNETSMTDPRGQTTRYEYDGRGLRTKTIYPDGTTDESTYDELGREVAKKDQAGNVTRFEYDALDHLTKVTDALGHVTTYAYDETGLLTSQTDADNHTTRYEYDAAGRRTKRTLPLGMSETLAYDGAGNLISRTDFRGKTTAYSYDSLNRLLSKTSDPSLNEPRVSFTYTQTGRRATMTDATGVTTYQYDALDRLTRKATPFGALSYTYDAAGNLSSMRGSSPDGAAVNYTYDALNRLSQVIDEQAAQATSSYSYDENGNLAGMSYPNGVRVAYTYDALNRLTRLTAGGSSTLASYDYVLGPSGSRLSVTERGGRTVSYTYDALYRLTGEAVSGDAVAGAVSYTYDAVGNRLKRASTLSPVSSSTSSYDANDRLAGNVYDGDGNTTATAFHSYAYDSEDRLKAVDGDAVVFAYDGDGNRVAKTVAGVTTRYLVDDLNPTGRAQVIEESVGGSVVRSYTYGHQLISQRRLVGDGWEQSFYGYDGHGSVRYLTDPAGAVTDTYTYDAFGNLIGGTGATPNDYLYAGERFDPDAGLYYLRARYMNPETGRFQSADPYEGEGSEPLTLHKYLYAGADPVNKIDPTGEAYTLSEMLTVIRNGLIIASTYPKVMFIADVAYSALVPFEVAGTASFGLGAAVGIGAATNLATKELPLVRRLFERSAGMDKAAAGTLFEEWFGKVLGATQTRLVIKGGQVISQNVKQSAVLDYLFQNFVIEIKLTAGALKKNQAQELAEFAKKQGMDLIYVFFKEPPPQAVQRLEKWVAERAAGMNLSICYLYK
jgi:RHS repeat-associated protein